MKAMRVCAVRGCPALTRQSYCSTHEAEARARRGTTTQQGLGWAHQRRRRELLPDAIGKPCAMGCGRIITSSNAALDHSDPRALGNRGPGDRIICAPCNNEMGGKLAQQLRHRT
jgi:hypothetical protein